MFVPILLLVLSSLEVDACPTKKLVVIQNPGTEWVLEAGKRFVSTKPLEKGQKNQQWYLVCLNNGTCYIHSEETGKVITVQCDGNCEETSMIIVADKVDKDEGKIKVKDQLWMINSDKTIASASISNAVMTMVHKYAIFIVTQAKNGTANQEFVLVNV